MVAEGPGMDETGTTASRQDSRSDRELIAAVDAGDALAFEVLYHRYRDWVVALAYRFTGDRDLALDVLQETFLYFVKKFPGFQLTASLKTFLYPAVQHLSIAARRQSQRFQSTESDLERLEGSMTTDPIMAEEELLRGVLASLSPGHREVLLLRFVEGLSLGEIAEAMDLPLGTVKSRLHNALGTLRADKRTKEFFEE